MSFAAIAVAVVGAGVAAYGQRQAGIAQKEGAEYNALIQERQADEARQTMIENLRRKRDNKSRIMGSVAVGQAARGLAVDSGSLALEEIEIDDRLDQEINDYTDQALAAEEYQRSQARMTRYAGESADYASKYQATGTILGGLGDGFGAYTQAVKLGRTPDTFGLYKNQRKRY